MTKKARRGAVRYATASRKGKRRHRPRSESGAAAQPTPQPLHPTESVTPRPTPRPGPRPRRIVETRYLTAELKRIGIIAGGMIVVLIVLAFVLG